MKKSRIVVIGSYLVALVMDTDRIPQKCETLLARNFRQVHGGKGSNQAVQAARLGAPVSFMGFVGDDSYGGSFIELCREEQIDHSNVRHSSSLPTGAGLIICSSDGNNIITIDIGANRDLNPTVIDELCQAVFEGDIVLIQFEVPLDSALYAARVANERGAIVIINPAPAADLSNYDLSFIDIITPNETEARICCGFDRDTDISDEDAAMRLLDLGCKNVIITQGEKGCLILNEHGFYPIPAFSFSKIVDSTGAGDAFNAALAVGLLEGRKLTDACLFANAAAGLACTKSDTIPSYHSRSDVDKLITHNS
jgi:ribokinase